MRAAAIIVMPFVLIYLAAVMVSLSWNPCGWPLWVIIAAIIFATANALLWVGVWFVSQIKTEEE